MISYLFAITAGASMVLLAGWLVWINGSHRATRAFAFVSATKGLALACLSLAVISTSLASARLFMTLAPAFTYAAIFGIAYFAVVYPKPARWLPDGWSGPALFFLPLLALEIALLANPELNRPLGTLTDTGIDAIPRWALSAPQGPFGSFQTLMDLVMAVVAFVFAREYFDSRPGRRRTTLLLVSLGFFVPAACSCLMAAIGVQMRGVMPPPVDPTAFNYLEMAMFGAWFVLLGGLVVYLGVRALRTENPTVRRHVALFAFVLVLAATVGTLVAWVPSPEASIRAIFAMLGLWSLLGALLVTYAVVRQRLFDIDIKLKLTLKRSTVAAIFVAVYFAVSESAAVLFEGFWGSPYLGIAAAAGLLLVLSPLERFAGRLAGEAMPRTRPLGDLDRDERAAFYREHLELIWMDERISAKDRLVLASLRQKLGLDPETAERLELEVVGGNRGDPTDAFPRGISSIDSKA